MNQITEKIEKLGEDIKVTAISEEYRIGFAKLPGNYILTIGFEKDAQNEQSDILILNSNHEGFKTCLKIVGDILRVYKAGDTMDMILPGNINDPIIQILALTVQHINKCLEQKGANK